MSLQRVEVDICMRLSNHSSEAVVTDMLHMFMFRKGEKQWELTYVLHLLTKGSLMVTFSGSLWPKYRSGNPDNFYFRYL